jgi:hypothetical protein
MNPNYKVIADEGPYLQVCETQLGAVGYIMTRPLAEFVLKKYGLCREPIDRLYARLSHQGIFYQLTKPIVGVQLGLESDIWPGRPN